MARRFAGLVQLEEIKAISEQGLASVGKGHKLLAGFDHTNWSQKHVFPGWPCDLFSQTARFGLQASSVCRMPHVRLGAT